MLKATHGSDKTPLKFGEIEIPCYVLDDGTRVLSGRGIQKALGAGDIKSGTWLKRFINTSAVSPNFDEQTLDRLNNPIKFKRPVGLGSQPSSYGYDATLLIDICDAILRTNTNENPLEYKLVKSAEVILRSVAKVGIIALIDEITGYQYDREKNELQKILQAYVAEEILDWQKTFHDSFYKEIFRLKKWDFTVNGIKNRPGIVGTYTTQFIYNQLPNGVIESIKSKTPKSEGGNYLYRFHQSLTPEIGREHLRNQLVSVTTLLNISRSWEEFKRLFARKYGQQEMDFDN